MKRFLSVLLISLLLFSLTACGSKTETKSSEQTDTSGKGEDTAAGQIPEEENIKTNGRNGILIVYFSRWGNTDYPDDVDATSSASIVVENDTRFGTTEYIANIIADKTGGNLHRIETAAPYTADFDELRDVNHEEMDQGYLPELKESDLDISGYGTVFIGYPVWATEVPQAVLSFLNEYDLSGKTIVPFCTHDGYGAGSSYRTIEEASHGSVVLDGIAIESKDVPGAQAAVTDGLAEIGY